MSVLAVDAIAAEVAAVVAVVERHGFHHASVSPVYLTGREPDAWWRCCVGVNDSHAFQPRFRHEADAEAYREAVTAALDRLA